MSQVGGQKNTPQEFLQTDNSDVDELFDSSGVASDSLTYS